MTRNVYSTLSVSITLSVLVFLLPLNSKAQKKLDEGRIIYRVRIESTEDGNTTLQAQGRYTYIVKDKQLRKELKLDNGYEDIWIYNGYNNTMFSLQKKDGKKYAIQLNTDDYRKKNMKYEGFSIRDIDTHQQVGKYEGIKATVTYKDGKSYPFTYTKEWEPPFNFMYDIFPAVKSLPLSYVYDSENGIAIYFTIESIKSEPIDNSFFRLPPDYVVISYKEYRQLNK